MWTPPPPQPHPIPTLMTQGSLLWSQARQTTDWELTVNVCPVAGWPQHSSLPVNLWLSSTFLMLDWLHQTRRRHLQMTSSFISKQWMEFNTTNIKKNICQRLKLTKYNVLWWTLLPTTPGYCCTMQLSFYKNVSLQRHLCWEIVLNLTRELIGVTQAMNVLIDSLYAWAYYGWRALRNSSCAYAPNCCAFGDLKEEEKICFLIKYLLNTLFITKNDTFLNNF